MSNKVKVDTYGSSAEIVDGDMIIRLKADHIRQIIEQRYAFGTKDELVRILFTVEKKPEVKPVEPEMVCVSEYLKEYK